MKAILLQAEPKKIQNRKVHLAPEFKTFTYVEPSILKRKALLELKKNDLLVFYLSGVLHDYPKEKGCYIFGYFVVDKVFDLNNLSDKEKKEVTKICKDNAHIRSSKSKNNFVIVKGNSKSKQLKRCIPISKKNKKSKNPAYLASDEMKKFLGIREAITRAVQIKIENDKYIENLRLLLGIKKFDPEQYEGKIPFSMFAGIIEADRKLRNDEKLFLKNFMMSKGNDYKMAADNFGLDVYTLDNNFRNQDLMEEYFMNYFYIVD